MDNRSRVITALNHTQPDRVPYHVWMNESMQMKMVEYYGDPRFLDNLGNCFEDIGDYAKNYKKTEKNIWQDQFGVLWDRSVEKELGAVCNRIISPENIDEYEFPDPQSCLAQTVNDREISQTSDQFRFIQLGFSLFERAWTLAGMENLLAAMIDDEAFVNKLLDKIMEFNLGWIEQAGALAIDALFFGDDWGQQTGLLMGPRLWQRFIKPRFAKMCKFAKDKGKYVFLHSCGKVQEIFPDLIECGVDLFNPFQPEVMDVFEIKQMYGQRLSFFGGISIQKTLPFGTADQTRDEVKRLLEDIGTNGGYVAGPSHSIPDAKVENVAAMIEVLRNQ